MEVNMQLMCEASRGRQSWRRSDGLTRRGVCASLVIVALVFTLNSTVMAGELHVPSQYPSIQAAIDAAGDGDEVVIADGTYTGVGNRELDLNGKAITVRSAAGDPNRCVIDCELAGRGLNIHSGEGAETLLQGLTITHGSSPIGGGVLCTSSSPTFSKCVIRECASTGDYGGGVFCSNGSPTFDQCTIRDNVTGTYGGGVHCHTLCNPVFKNCTISGNDASRDIGYGGGVYCYITCNPTFIECTIRDNYAKRQGGGVACNANCVVTLLDCEINENLTSSNGGGLSILDSSSLNMIGCRIYNNTGAASGGIELNGDASLVNCIILGNVGDGIENSRACNISIVNSTIVGNAGNGVEIGEATCAISNSILWENELRHHGGKSSLRALDKTNVTVAFCIIDTGWTGIGAKNVDPQLTPQGYLTRHSPCIDAGDMTFLPVDALDLDGDGNTSERIPYSIHKGPRYLGVCIDLGADEFLDTDQDDLPDWLELQYSGTVAGLDPNSDEDGDQLSNRYEYLLSGSNLNGPIWYVNASTGSDAFDGRSDTPDAAGAGPKQTLQAALDVAASGDTVLVAAGTYVGAGNFELDFGGRSIVLNASEKPAPTVIDCGGLGHALLTSSFDRKAFLADYPTLDGFTIQNGNATSGGAIYIYDRILLSNCVLENSTALGGGGFRCFSNYPVFGKLSVRNNVSSKGSAGLITGNAHLTLLDTLSIETGELWVTGAHFSGDGDIYLARDASLYVYFYDPSSSVTTVQVPIYGQGDIEIAPGATLQVEQGVVIDLSNQGDPNQSSESGTITVEGSLIVQDAAIENTNIIVKYAEIEGVTDILDNDIDMPPVSKGFGGQFFVAGTSIISGNHIISQGDRYLDYDPDPTLPPSQRPVVEFNTIEVQITQGVDDDQGELLELRARDYDCGGPANPYCASGAFQSIGSQGFTDDPSKNWVLESLEILPDAKVNLTNRQGFDFQVDLEDPEAVYVHTLKLHPGAVLNTALQSLYYESLVNENDQPLLRDPNHPTAPLANGSRIVDVPLLGFSLKVIAMEDDEEFKVRVRPRTSDPEVKPQPCPCQGGCAGGIGSITRIPASRINDPNNHAMEMRTHAYDKDAACSIAAKGAFARAGEDEIVVAFDYRFVETPDPNTVLIVYLSDDSDVSENLVEVARVYPPLSPLSGSVDSSEFAAFFGRFARGDLNFHRGTYVELELRGTDAVLLIDNWDPQIICSSTRTCGDFGTPDGVASDDFLYILGEYGQALSNGDGLSPKWCLDQLTGDGFIDLDDVLLWDTFMSNAALPNLCGDVSAALAQAAQNASVSATPTNPSATLSSSLAANRLVVAGKAKGDPYYNLLADSLYTFNASDGAPDAQLPPAGRSDYEIYRANGRLVVDSQERLYQLHGVLGLIRLSDGEVVLAPQNAPLPFGDNEVQVGIAASLGNGEPVRDADFDVQDPNILYVVPVQVQPAGGSSYRAAARLRLMPNGPEVEQLYGLDPASDPTQHTTPPGLSVVDVQHLKEIAVDAFGNVFVTAGQHLNDNSWLLVYDPSGDEQRYQLSESALGGIAGPTALTLSRDGQQLYLASTATTYGATSTRICRYQMMRTAGDSVSDLTCDPATDVLTITGMRDVISIVEHPCSGALWIVGTQWDEPANGDWDEWAQTATFTGSDPLFTNGVLAVAPPGESEVAAAPFAGVDLALPVSAVFYDAAGSVSDLNCDGAADGADLLTFELALAGPDVTTPPAAVTSTTYRKADRDGDQDVDLRDLAQFMR